jgi:hypothetical protein
MSNDASENDSDGVKELLLADLKYLNDCFWKNEEVGGEKRVTFFITLVGAVLAFLGALAAKTNGSHSQKINIFASVFLLSIGAVTLFRIIKRNKVSDKYKDGQDYIRDMFKKYFDHGRCLVDYDPFFRSKKIWADGHPLGAVELRKFGGLAHIVASLNSLIFAALVGFILWEAEIIHKLYSLRLIIGGLVAFIITYGLQYIFIATKEKLAREEIIKSREIIQRAQK